MRKFVKVLVVLLGVVLVLAIGAYVFRAELTRFVAGHMLKQQGVELTCAQWDLNPIDGNVHAQQLCLSYQGHQAELFDVTLGFEQIDINQANITLGPLPKGSDTSSSASPLDLPLPLVRPLITVDSLNIEGAPLPQPVQFSVHEKQLNQFQLGGDVIGELTLQADEVTFDLVLESKLTTELNRWLDENIEPQSQWQMYFDDVHLEGSYSGDAFAVVLKQRGQLNGELMQSCPAEVALQGSTRIRSDDMSSFLINASALNIQLAHQAQCPSLDNLTAYIEPVLKAPWQLRLPQPVTASSSLIATKRLVLTNGSEAHHVEAEFNEVHIALAPFAMQAQYQADVKLPELGEMSLAGTLSSDSIAGQFSANLPARQIVGVSVTESEAQGDFDYTLKGNGSIKAVLTTDKISMDDNHVENVKLTTQAYLQANNIFESEWLLNAKSATAAQNKLQGISTKVTAQGELRDVMASTRIQGKTKIAQVKADKFIVSDVAATSHSQSLNKLSFTHQLSWQGVKASLKHETAVHTSFSFTLPTTAMTELKPLIEQVVPQLHASEGEISLQASGVVADSTKINWRFNLEDATLVYQNYLFKHANTQAQGTWNSSKLHFPTTNFSVSQVRAGPVVNNITGKWRVTDEFEVYLQDVQGAIFDGQVALDKLYVTGLEKERPSSLVTLSGVDVAQLVELEAQQGISVSGIVGARLPLMVTEQGVSIEGGRLFNESKGKLSIDNNAAFNAVKAQQQELGPILSLLENLDIHDINADVDLKTDGWLDVKMQLKGENPNQKQAVNFNYNHQENIYTLFRALRLSDEITKKVEQEYQAKE